MARRQLEEASLKYPQPVPRSGTERLVIAAERLSRSLRPTGSPTKRTSITRRPGDERRAAVRPGTKSICAA